MKSCDPGTVPPTGAAPYRGPIAKSGPICAVQDRSQSSRYIAMERFAMAWCQSSGDSEEIPQWANRKASQKLKLSCEWTREHADVRLPSIRADRFPRESYGRSCPGRSSIPRFERGTGLPCGTKHWGAPAARYGFRLGDLQTRKGPLKTRCGLMSFSGRFVQMDPPLRSQGRCPSVVVSIVDERTVSHGGRG